MMNKINCELYAFASIFAGLIFFVMGMISPIWYIGFGWLTNSFLYIGIGVYSFVPDEAR